MERVQKVGAIAAIVHTLSCHAERPLTGLSVREQERNSVGLGAVKPRFHSQPRPQNCDCATLHGKRDFTDALCKDLKTGVYPGVSGGPDGIAKALGRGRQQARVREVMMEAEVSAGLCKQEGATVRGTPGP